MAKKILITGCAGYIGDIIVRMLANENYDIVGLDNHLFAAAFELFSQRPDKEWSLTDCLSFVIMRQRGIKQALAADEHFAQASLVPLLLDG